VKFGSPTAGEPVAPGTVLPAETLLFPNQMPQLPVVANELVRGSVIFRECERAGRAAQASAECRLVLAQVGVGRTGLILCPRQGHRERIECPIRARRMVPADFKIVVERA
jgi:hypothetical protein